MLISTPPNAGALIDEYGELSRRLAERAPDEARAKELSSQFQTWYAGQPAEQAFALAGSRYTLQVSPRKKERKVRKIAKIFTLLGKARFLEVARLTLADLDAAVPAELQEKYSLIETALTGSRTVKAVALAAQHPQQGKAA